MRVKWSRLGRWGRLLAVAIVVAVMGSAAVAGFDRVAPISLQRYLRDRATVFKDQLKDSRPLRLALGKSDTRASTGDGGAPDRALLYDPTGVAMGSGGTLYVSERRNHRIRLVRNGRITTLAGNGRQGFAGEGMPGPWARLNRPEGLDLDPSGNLYVADSFNHRVRRIGPDGRIITVAGTGSPGYSGDGGPASEAQLNAPMDVKVGPDGSLYIAERDNHCIRRVDPHGVITTVAGTGEPGISADGGPAIEARLVEPYGLDVGPDGVVYIADSGTNRVRKVTADGIITTIAGTGLPGYAGDGGPATAALLDSPQAVAVMGEDGLLVNDEHNHALRLIRPDGVIETVAGTGSAGFSGDGGPAVTALLNDPEYLFADSQGRIVLSDGDNDRIRVIDSTGTIHTIVGRARNPRRDAN